MDWFGLGKKRTKLGKWLDQHGVSQTEFAKMSKVSRPTISRLCSAEENHEPTMKTAKKIIKTIKEKLGKDVHYDDFWSM
ncbi:helix-turn-helix domain-containing protein [Sutcliffiella halmapala]